MLDVHMNITFKNKKKTNYTTTNFPHKSDIPKLTKKYLSDII